MLDFLKAVGPFVGIIAFTAFCVLLFLYIQRARELHRIRKDAPFLTEGKSTNGHPDD